MSGTGRKPIFLSMAAIDGERAEKYRWLPERLGRQGDELFPLQNHRIAASARTDNRQKIALMNRKIYIMERGGFSLHRMVGITHVSDFH